MDFALLGPLEVRDGDRVLQMGSAKQRALLAILLLRANRVVSADQLIEALWGDETPQGATNALHAYVSRVRKILGENRIVTRAPGYVIEAKPSELDLERFRRLAEAGRRALVEGNPPDAASRLGAALALWRGPPLAEFAFEPFAQGEIARLEEQRMAALEDRIEAELRLRRDHDLVAELESLVAEHPLRERLRRQLMLALYRCGRQAEALETYQRGRRVLVEELGIEPSPLLQRLQAGILQQDPSLDLPEPPPLLPQEVAEPTVRKAVTVVYTEVTCVAPDPEVLGRTRVRAEDVVTPILERHGALVERRAGQGLFGFFGLPSVHEDDALRAVRAAVEAQQALRAAAKSSSEQIAARIAVDTGSALASAGRLIEAGAARGATRLAELASEGEIIIGTQTRRLVRDGVRLEPTPTGGAWRLVEIHSAAETVLRHFDAPLIGRREELSHLRQAFESAVRRRTCHLFTVLGAAGIGKSRLARELADELGESAVVLTGRCLPYGEGITFWPLLEVVRKAVGETTKTALLDVLEGDEYAEAVADRVATALGSGDSGAGEDTAWAFRRLFEAVAKNRPLLLVLEDIHWAEATLLDTIDHVADWSRAAPMLILCLARPELLDERPGWAGGKFNATSVLLDGLSESESQAMMAALPAPRMLSDEERARIAGVAEGNPLFIEQMLALAGEDRAGAQLTVPPTIQALLSARLDRLSADELITIQRASVLGREFWRDALEALGTDEERSWVAPALGKLVRKELIGPDQSTFPGKEAYRFRHILIRDSAYESIPKETRAELHELLAEWLERAAGDRASEFDEILGYHFEQAHQYRSELGASSAETGALAAKAAHKLVAAGRRGLARCDIPAARNLLARAIPLLSDDETSKAETLGALAFALRERGEWAEAEAHLNSGISLAAARRDRPLELHLRVTHLQYRLFADPHTSTHELIRENVQLLDLLTELEQPRYAARARTLLGWMHLLIGQAKVSEDLLKISSEYAREADDIELLNDCRRVLFAAWLYGPSHAEYAARCCNTVLKEEPPLRVKASGLRCLALLAAMEGRFDEARGLAASDDRIMDELGLTVAAAGRREILGVIEILAENFSAAERHVSPGLKTLRKLGENMYAASLAAVLAQALYRQERYEEAFRLTRLSEQAANREVGAQVRWRSVRAKLLAKRGDVANAQEFGSEAVRLAGLTDFLDLRGEALMELSEVFSLIGERSRAVTTLKRAIGLFDSKGNLVSAKNARTVLNTLTSSF